MALFTYTAKLLFHQSLCCTLTTGWLLSGNVVTVKQWWQWLHYHQVVTMKLHCSIVTDGIGILLCKWCFSLYSRLSFAAAASWRFNSDSVSCMYVTIHHKRALKSASTCFWFAGLYNHSIAVTFEKTEVL